MYAYRSPLNPFVISNVTVTPSIKPERFVTSIVDVSPVGLASGIAAFGVLVNDTAWTLNASKQANAASNELDFLVIDDFSVV